MMTQDAVCRFWVDFVNSFDQRFDIALSKNTIGDHSMQTYNRYLQIEFLKQHYKNKTNLDNLNKKTLAVIDCPVKQEISTIQIPSCSLDLAQLDAFIRTIKSTVYKMETCFSTANKTTLRNTLQKTTVELEKGVCTELLDVLEPYQQAKDRHAKLLREMMEVQNQIADLELVLSTFSK